MPLPNGSSSTTRGFGVESLWDIVGNYEVIIMLSCLRVLVQ
jgi:hypothetical protein